MTHNTNTIGEEDDGKNFIKTLYPRILKDLPLASAKLAIEYATPCITQCLNDPDKQNNNDSNNFNDDGCLFDLNCNEATYKHLLYDVTYYHT